MSELEKPTIDKSTLSDIMKAAQEMQKKMQVVQQELLSSEIIGESGAGYVKITMNGRYITKRVFIDPALLKEPKNVMEDLIAAAINDATNKVEKLSQNKLQALSKNLGIDNITGAAGTGDVTK